MWGETPWQERSPVSRGGPGEGAAQSIQRESTGAHLRSNEVVTGYRIEALDGEIGHVAGFVVDEEVWAIRYIVVATRNWWPRKKVLV